MTSAAKIGHTYKVSIACIFGGDTTASATFQQKASSRLTVSTESYTVTQQRPESKVHAGMWSTWIGM